MINCSGGVVSEWGCGGVARGVASEGVRSQLEGGRVVNWKSKRAGERDSRTVGKEEKGRDDISHLR